MLLQDPQCISIHLVASNRELNSNHLKQKEDFLAHIAEKSSSRLASGSARSRDSNDTSLHNPGSTHRWAFPHGGNMAANILYSQLTQQKRQCPVGGHPQKSCTRRSPTSTGSGAVPESICWARGTGHMLTLDAEGG